MKRMSAQGILVCVVILLSMSILITTDISTDRDMKTLYIL